MSISSETEFLSNDGNTRTVIRFSERDEYIEISQSRIVGNKKTQTIILSIATLNENEATTLCEIMEQAINIIYNEIEDN